MGTRQEDESPTVGREAPTATDEVPEEKGVSSKEGTGGDLRSSPVSALN